MIIAHLAHGNEGAPQESNHALNADALRAPDIHFFALFEAETPLGCGALKDLGDGLIEVKSVHVIASARRRGLARKIIKFLEKQARANGFRSMVLETGSDLLPEFDAARRLYSSLGFRPCAPIPGYKPDPYSVFLRLGLDPEG